MAIAAAGEVEVRGGDEGGGGRAGDDGVAHVAIDIADDGCAARAAAERQQEEEGVCRICHLGDGDGDGELPESMSGRLVRLGCGCRGELAVAHRRCAEAWFSIRGDSRCCEICGKSAVNIRGGAGSQKFMRQWNEAAGVDGRGSPKVCGFTRGQSCCNLLIACFIIVFVLPWLRHNHII